MNEPKILLFDIETAPMLSYTWGLWDQNLSLDQIQKDWHILSWAAKWLNNPKIMYEDQRNAKNIEDDSKILRGIWKLLDEADIVITQNGVSFDSKKLNARFILNGMQPPSPYKHIDTFLIAKKNFAFTSNKLEYMSKKLNTKFKKLEHAEFGGFKLWSECLKGNKRAWAEMEKYNKHDVLALEELYKKLAPWDNTVNLNVYRSENTPITCSCGSTHFVSKGFVYTPSGKFRRYTCTGCGHSTRGKTNQLSIERRKTLRLKAA
jgi:hypothetical protein